MSSDDESVDLTKLIKASNEYYDRRKKLRQVVEAEEEERLKQPTVYRHRRWEGCPPYDMSSWGRMLVNPRTQDSIDWKGGILFRRRFRLPFPLFQRSTDMTRANEWYSEGNDCAGVKAAPLELKVL